MTSLEQIREEIRGAAKKSNSEIHDVRFEVTSKSDSDAFWYF